VNTTQWAYASNNLIYSAMVVYLLAMLTYGMELASGLRSTSTRAQGGVLLVQRSTRLAGIAFALTTLAFALHLAGVLSRGIAAGRVPWGNMYEFSTTGAMVATGIYLLLYRRLDLRWLGIFIVPAVLITLGTAVMLLYRPVAPLVPALQSGWLVIHVATAILSGGVFLVSNAIAATYLILERRDGDRPMWAQRIPSLDALDQMAYRLIAFIFPIWTFSIIAGAIWAEAAWGRYWGWDPKETWAFITWVGYAAYLHARVTVGWRGRRAAWLALIAGSTYLFNYVWVNIWGTGKHTYSGL